MPNFQGAVNQVIGMAGAFRKMDEMKPATPEEVEEAKRQQELSSLERQSSALDSAMEEAAQSSFSTDERTAPGKVVKEIAKEQQEVARRQFMLDPSRESWKRYITTRSFASDEPVAVFEGEEEPEIERQEMAMQDMERKRRAMAAQKKSSSDYIGNLPISLGGKVKDLDPKLQEQIRQKYMEANDGEQE